MSDNRIKRPVSYALDPKTLDRLDAWIARQEVPPTKTAAIEAALKAWLDAREVKRKAGCQISRRATAQDEET